MILLCYFHLNQNTKIPNNSNFYATIWLYLVSCTTRSLQTSCLLTRSVFPLSLKNTKKGCILHGFGVSFSTTSKLFQTSWHLQSRKHEKGKDNKKEGSLHDASHSIRILIDWITRTIHHHFFPALTLTALTKFSVHWLENLIFFRWLFMLLWVSSWYLMLKEWICSRISFNSKRMLSTVIMYLNRYSSI